MYTYIVIDDESLIRKGTIKKLQPMEEQITCIGEADNGKAGIELIQEVHPDIVILDMQMPINFRSCHRLYSETIQQGGNPGLHFPRD